MNFSIILVFTVLLPLCEPSVVKLTNYACEEQSLDHSFPDQAGDEGGAADQADRVHGGGRRARGEDRLPAGEGVGARDVQDPGGEPLGHRRAQRGGACEEEVGLRGAGTRENNRLLGDHHQQWERR